MFYQLEHIGAENLFKRETGKNFNYPLHLHQSFELIFLNEGEMRVCVNGNFYTLKKGQAVLVFPNQLHSLQSVSSKHTLFIFSPHLIQTFYVDKNGKLPKNNLFTLPKNLVFELDNFSNISSKYQLKGLLYAICGMFDNQREYYNVATSKQNTIFQVLYYVEKNFKKSCSVCEIAKNTSLNPDYLSRIFKQKLGVSCKNYVNLRRLSYATHLLSTTDETCLSCALDSGFSSLRSFNRNFKAHFGVSPLKYKSNIQMDFYPNLNI